MHKLDAWRARIDATRTERELLAVIGAYCDGWLPSELSQLPAHCQDCRPADGAQLGRLAVDFKRAELAHSGSPAVASLLRDMSQTFAYAAERLRVFHHPSLKQVGD